MTFREVTGHSQHSASAASAQSTDEPCVTRNTTALPGHSVGDTCTQSSPFDE
jgi:hypothetical protein